MVKTASSQSQKVQKIFGGDHGIRKFTLMRDHLARSGDLSGDFQGSSEKSQPLDKTKDDAEAQRIFVDRRGFHSASRRTKRFIGVHEVHNINEKPRDGKNVIWWRNHKIWCGIRKASQRKEKPQWAIEKPKLNNARKLRGIYFIDPDDGEFKDKRTERVGISSGSRCAL